MEKQKIKIIRDWFIPWILEDEGQESLVDAWDSGEAIEDYALSIAGLIPIDHIKNWDEIKHHYDLDQEDYPCIHEGFDTWSAYFEYDGYIQGVPETLEVEWVSEK